MKVTNTTTGKYLGDEGREKTLSILKKNGLVANSEEIARAIYDSSIETVFQNNDVVIRQDDIDDDSVYFLISGSVEIKLRGKSRVVLREAPSQVGEMAALNASDVRSATVRAKGGQIVVRKISAHEFNRICQSSPDFRLRALEEQNDRNKAWKAPKTEVPWFDKFVNSKVLIQLFAEISVLITSFWIGSNYPVEIAIVTFFVLTIIILALPIWFNRTRLLYACFMTGCLGVLAYLTAPFLVIVSLRLGWISADVTSQTTAEAGHLLMMAFVLLILLGAAIFSNLRDAG